MEKKIKRKGGKKREKEKRKENGRKGDPQASGSLLLW